MAQIISKVCYECSLHPDKCKGKSNIKTCSRMQPDYDVFGVDESATPARPIILRPMVASDLANDTTLRNIQHGAGDDVEHIDQGEIDATPDVTDVTETTPTGSKHDNFVRLRDARLKTVLHHIHLLGNLSMPNYEYSIKEANDLVAGLQKATADVRKRFGVTLISLI